MFDAIWVEEEALHYPHTKQILEALRNPDFKTIDRVENYFGKFKKPYLQKRDDLNLYIGVKRGNLVKLAPPAYGTSGSPHYYFIHAYNCVYECQYCYLQGHFSSPDLVFFVNHQDIVQEMKKVIDENQDKREIWFHAGEFSDSLALSHITNELPLYFEFFREHPEAYLELRTKSANIRALRLLPPLHNVVVSFSLAPQTVTKEIDLKTPSLPARLKALQELHQLGFKIALHFDPIIYQDNLLRSYQELIEEIQRFISLNSIEYLSLGVVRFTKDVYEEVKKNYPDSLIHQYPMITSQDKKVRYHRPFRLHLLNHIKNNLIEAGLSQEKIYLCMEE